jgi:CRISPR/Cas system CSM-associated protein Csm3 (group 7 of RAMP superfamily)
MSASDRMTGAGRVREIGARWVVTGEVVLVTACHLGGEATGATDMALLRDARQGAPLLPGTTLAGALRSHLADVLAGFRKREPAAVATLFGGDRGDDEGSQSPLVVFDSFGELPRNAAVELRDGVSIDAASGTAEDHKKYDLEVLPPGTTFLLRLELVVSEPQKEDELLSLLTASLDGLATGRIALGARRSRGLGAITTRAWRARRFDLSTATGWVDWLTSDAVRPTDSGIQATQTPRDAVTAALKRSGLKVTLATPADRSNRVIADVTLSFPGGLLVRSPPATASAPDAVHLVSGGRSVLPGTSVAGALRTQALRIVRCVAEREGARAVDDAVADDAVAKVFGPRLHGISDPNFKPSASRLRVSESALTARRVRTTRIRVDRFTQGVTAGALFDEEPVVDAKMKLTIELRDPEDWELGLLVLLLKDLLSGDIPLGGTVAIGRGACTGRAELRVAKWPRPIALAPGASPPSDDLTRLDDVIGALGGRLRARTEGGAM